MARTTRILVALVAAVSLIAVAPGAEGQDPDPVAPGENGPVMESDPEVVGGTVAANGEFPWLVALTQRGQPATSQFCGGSLIAPRRVLTAAHCVVGIVGPGQTTPANQLSVLVGTNVLNGSGRRINVIDVHVHPNWNRNVDTFRNDLAALDLAQPANRPLLRTARPNQAALGNAGRQTTVAGWGRVTPNSPGPSSFVIRKASFPIVNRNICQSYHPGPTEFRYVHATNVCAGRPNVDSCSGDSGGPLVTGSGPNRVQVGIVSFGRIQCGTAPGVYTRVSAYGLGNDAFTTPKILPPTGRRSTTQTFVAGKQPGEPNHAGNRGGASAWFAWQAPRTGNVVFNTGGSNFDTLLAVYRGTAVNRLVRVASNDDVPTPGLFTSRVSFRAQRGVVYRIAVDGYDGDFGRVVLNRG